MSTVRLVPAGAPRSALAERAPARERFGGARLVRGRPLEGRRGVGSLLDLGLDVLVDRFGICVGIGVLCWLPLQIGSELVDRSRASAEMELAVQVLLTALSLVPKFLTTAFVCLVVAGHLLERPASIGEAVRGGLLRLPGLLCLVGMQLLGTFVLFCACLLPVLLSPWLFSIVPAVYVLERRTRGATGEGGSFVVRWSRGVATAFERGVRLVLGWGSLGRFFGYFLVATLTVNLPLSLVVGGLQAPGVREELDQLLGLSGGPVDLSLTVLTAVFVAIGTAYAAILDTVYYFDQRVRREGLDLELALGRLEAGGERHP